jgi:hypothetical protein
MHLLDRLLPQAIITLNMLRTSRINPKISAATHLEGQYEYNRAPMAPELLHMKLQIVGEHGQLWNIIDVTEYTLAKLEVKG